MEIQFNNNNQNNKINNNNKNNENNNKEDSSIRYRVEKETEVEVQKEIIGDEEEEEGMRMDIDENENLHSKLNSSIIPSLINEKQSFTLRSSSPFSSSSNPHVYINTQTQLQTHIPSTSPSNHQITDNHTHTQSITSSPALSHTDQQVNTFLPPDYPSASQHAQYSLHTEVSVPPLINTNTQNHFTGQSLPTPTAITPTTKQSNSYTYSRPILAPQSTSNHNRPIPLRLASSTSSSSSSSLRSTRRLNQSPYIVPSTAKLISTPSPNMSTPLELITVKNEPRTPIPLPVSPLIAVKNEPFDDENDNNHLLDTPKKTIYSPSQTGSKIGSSPGSMSMSQRRGVRPSFPSPRMGRTGSSNGNGNGFGNGVNNIRGLLTPQYSASGSSSSTRQIPYPTSSSIPLISAPLSPPSGQRWNQSAPPIPLSATIQPSTPQNGNGNGNGKGKQTNPYQVSLDEIPKDFVLKKLVQLASKYWYAPHSADCHIIVPIKRASRSPTIPSTPRTAVPPLHQRFSSQPHVPQTANNGGPSLHAQPGDSFFGPSAPTAASIQAAAQAGTTGEDAEPDVLTSSVTTMENNRSFNGDRRGSLPGGNQLEQCLVFPLHKDYLTTQSVLFRTLLNSQAAHLPNPPPRDPDGRLVFQSPVVRGAKVLPTKSDRPKALYIPLPDPASFGVILHWMYWHDADHFNHCLSKGLVTWQGVIRNIEYLSLDNEIKLLAGKWWKRWVKPTETNERRRLPTGPGSAIGSRISGNGSIKGKRRAFSTSSAKRDKMMNIDHDDEDEDFDEDEDDDDEEGDSGDEADDEDLEINGKRNKIGMENEDGFADHVSLRLGRL